MCLPGVITASPSGYIRVTVLLTVACAKDSVEDPENVERGSCRAWQGHVGVISCTISSNTSVYRGSEAHSGLHRHYW